jgi:CIC family chloride channel protein
MATVRALLSERLVPRVDERLLLMLLGIVVGVCAGLAAVALNRSIVALEHALHHWRTMPWSFVLPGLGAAASALFLTKIARESAGHGVPEVIFSVSRRGGLLRLRSSVSRLVSSCLTIGSGGSAGPEAPVVMSGSAIGSNIARGLGLNERQRIILLGCGAAGAIAAIFNAPIAGMVFAMEVILGEWSRISLAPIAIASVAGAEISHVLRGNQIPFGPAMFSIDTFDIVASAGLAVATAVASILLTRLLRRSHQMWERLPTPTWIRALLGGSTVGLIGLSIPIVLGEGYAAVRRAIAGELDLGLLLLMGAIVAKMIATSMTIGSGGSGGIFAPSLLVGSLVGLGYHHILTLAWPGHDWVGPGCFALLGMAGLVSGILQAPLTGIFLIFEITGGWSVILPLIVVSVVSSTVCQRVEPTSFYLRDLVRSGHLLRPGTDARVLADIRVRELLELDCTTVSEGTRLREFIPVVKVSQRNWFPVVDDDGRLLGMLHLDDLRPYLFSPEMYDAVVLGEVMDPEPMTVSPDDTLEHVLETMDRLPAFSLPVVEDDRFVGMISKATLLDQYRKELNVQTDV